MCVFFRSNSSDSVCTEDCLVTTVLPSIHLQINREAANILPMALR